MAIIRTRPLAYLEFKAGFFQVIFELVYDRLLIVLFAERDKLDNEVFEF